jgi:RimJ/RimL family protein N-acetyltransferase
LQRSLQGHGFYQQCQRIARMAGAGHRLASHESCIAHVHQLLFMRIELKVDNRNKIARGLYEKFGFATIGADTSFTTMSLNLRKP